MKEFKTLGPTQFGIGDGTQTRFSVARQGDVISSANVESVITVGWQGDVLLSPRPRTNLALFSNDFTNTAWKGSPSLYADFTTGNMPTGIDFSRASTATYWDADGILREADIDEPRFDHDPVTGEALGLLRERAATNLIPNSDSTIYFNHSDGSASISLTSEHLPPVSGVTHSTLVTVDPLRNSTFYQYQAGVPMVPSAPVTFSFFFKPLENIKMVGSESSAAGYFRFTYDLETGVLTTNPNVSVKVQKLKDGWYRFSATRISDFRDSTSGVTSIMAYRVDSTAGAPGSFLTSCYQMEAGEEATSYIRTTGTAATRAIDDITYAKADNSPLFPNGEFSVVIDFDTEEKPSTSRQVFSLSTTDSAYYIVSLYSNNNILSRYPMVNTQPVFGIDSGRQKIALALTSSRKSGSKSGEETKANSTQVDYIGDVNIVNFSSGYGLAAYNGHIRSFQLYSRALPDTKLQELSQI